jgi:uncharacterized Rossmann fold enzyme
MHSRLHRSLLILTLLALVPGSARAVLHAGDVTPDFHKTDLDGAAQTLFQYRGKVVVMFLMGYN